MQQKTKKKPDRKDTWFPLAFFYLLSLLLLLTAPSCHPAKSSYDPVLQNTGGENGGNPAAEQEMGGETPPFGENEETTSQETDEDPLTELLLWKPNELGDIIILMYHEIGSPEGEWRRTPENFRRDLQTLYGLGYRAVSLQDVVNGRIDIPAGTSPVVLTFDDGNKGNFNYLEIDGELRLDPECAVAIMEDFYQENPDFGLAATFYIYWPNPFRQPQYLQTKLDYLVEQGFEIGNHTNSHANLSRISPEEIRRELALHLRETHKYLPGYKVTSLSLPYGAYPKEPLLAREGSCEGTSYRHEAVLLVGANPAPSPYHKKFNPFKLPRIKASEIKTDGVGLYDWLEYFEENPSRRYISDGDANCITAPLSLEDNLDRAKTGEREARFYE